jgi:hypothetical protein
MVEGALERTRAAAAAAAAAAPAPRARPVLAAVAVPGVVGRLGLLLCLLLVVGLGVERVELGRDQLVVLGAQVALLQALAVVGREAVLALELVDVLDRDLELMRDPGVGAALANPGPDLIELRSQRTSRHGRGP